MKPGDIYWIEFPAGEGHEQQGRRPAVMLQDENYASKLPLAIVLPITGALGATRFAGTMGVEPDYTNRLQKSSVILVFQVRAVDRNMVKNRIGSIQPEQLERVYGILEALVGRHSAKPGEVV